MIVQQVFKLNEEKMEKVKEAELGTIEKPIAKDIYWFQYVVGFSGSVFNWRNTRIAAFHFSISIGSLILLSSAVAFGWNSPGIPKLRLENSPIPPITGGQSSWIVALMKVGSISASLCAIWMMNK